MKEAGREAGQILLNSRLSHLSTCSGSHFKPFSCCSPVCGSTQWLNKSLESNVTSLADSHLNQAKKILNILQPLKIPHLLMTNCLEYEGRTKVSFLCQKEDSCALFCFCVKIPIKNRTASSQIKLCCLRSRTNIKPLSPDLLQ